jgi:hypothetical protein
VPFFGTFCVFNFFFVLNDVCAVSEDVFEDLCEMSEYLVGLCW